MDILLCGAKLRLPQLFYIKSIITNTQLWYVGILNPLIFVDRASCDVPGSATVCRRNSVAAVIGNSTRKERRLSGIFWICTYPLGNYNIKSHSKLYTSLYYHIDACSGEWNGKCIWDRAIVMSMLVILISHYLYLRPGLFKSNQIKFLYCTTTLNEYTVCYVWMSRSASSSGPMESYSRTS